MISPFNPKTTPEIRKEASVKRNRGRMELFRGRSLPLRALVPFAFILFLWSAFTPTGEFSFRESEGASQDTEKRSEAQWFPEKPETAKAIGHAVAKLAFREGVPVWQLVADYLPTPAQTVAMLARDRDVDDFEESSEVGGQAGEHYSAVVALVPAMRPLRASQVAFFSEVYASMVEKGLVKASNGSVHPIAKKGEATPPRRRDMDLSHSYALDIFYSEVQEAPGTLLEIGPGILSASGGIVVATASDWKGGPGIETYRRGGISPNAGNGAIIFDPASGLFFCYFHLHDVRINPGMPVEAGTVIGRGGDTGSNARKPGHGQHLHLEIFDAASGRFLRNTEIRDLVF